MGIKIVNFGQQVLKPLRSYTQVFTVPKTSKKTKPNQAKGKERKNRFFFFIVHLPVPLEKFTTRPRAFFTNGRKVLVTSIIPHRFTSAIRLKVFSGVHSIGSVWRIPALFTRPHNPVATYNKRKQKCKSANVLTKTVYFDCPQKIHFAIY